LRVKRLQPLRGFEAFLDRGHQGDPDEIASRIDAMGFPGQVTAGQNGNIILLKQLFSELRIGDRRSQPEIESRFRHGDLDHGRQGGERLFEFFPIQPAILRHMFFIGPCSGAGCLDRRIHRAAMIGAIEQEFRENFRIAGDEAGAHARYVGSLRQAAERNEPAKIAAPQALRRLQGAERRPVLVEVDLRVTLVRSDDKTVAIRQFEQGPPLVDGHDIARRIARRADIDQLCPAPHLFRQLPQIEGEPIVG